MKRFDAKIWLSAHESMARVEQMGISADANMSKEVVPEDQLVIIRHILDLFKGRCDELELTVTREGIARIIARCSEGEPVTFADFTSLMGEPSVDFMMRWESKLLVARRFRGAIVRRTNSWLGRGHQPIPRCYDRHRRGVKVPSHIGVRRRCLPQRAGCRSRADRGRQVHGCERSEVWFYRDHQ